VGESDIATGSDRQALKIEKSFSLYVGLTLFPTASVRFNIILLHWRQHIEDHQVR
jgi:hypothetical protein